MILLREFNQETKKLLTRISRSSKFSQVRNRAKCIILSYQGVSIVQLSVDTQSKKNGRIYCVGGALKSSTKHLLN